MDDADNKKQVDKDLGNALLQVIRNSVAVCVLSGNDGVVVQDFTDYNLYHTQTDSGSKIELLDRAPRAYHLLRRAWGIQPRDYLDSWTSSGLSAGISLTRGISGRSGSLFLFSSDKRYLLKTLRGDESHFLENTLHDYYHYMTSRKDSLLARMLGHYRITLEGKSYDVMIQCNVFHTSLSIDYLFDLKGSTLGRYATEEEKKKPHHVLKDVDFINSQREFALPDELGNLFVQQLEEDATFLKEHEVVDYSLLVGIHELEGTKEGTKEDKKKKKPKKHNKKKKQKDDNSQEDDNDSHKKKKKKKKKLKEKKHKKEVQEEGEEAIQEEGKGKRREGDQEEEKEESDGKTVWQQYHNGICSEGNREVYFFGIIDFLSTYNARKKLVHLWKHNILFNDSASISIVNPEYYADRFVKFLSPRFGGSGKKIE